MAGLHDQPALRRGRDRRRRSSAPGSRRTCSRTGPSRRTRRWWLSSAPPASRSCSSSSARRSAPRFGVASGGPAEDGRLRRRARVRRRRGPGARLDHRGGRASAPRPAGPAAGGAALGGPPRAERARAAPASLASPRARGSVSLDRGPAAARRPTGSLRAAATRRFAGLRRVWFASRHRLRARGVRLRVGRGQRAGRDERARRRRPGRHDDRQFGRSAAAGAGRRLRRAKRRGGAPGGRPDRTTVGAGRSETRKLGRGARLSGERPADREAGTSGRTIDRPQRGRLRTRARCRGGSRALRGRVRRGNSGGPVLDSAGRVVGTVFAARIDGAAGYAVPPDVVDECWPRALGRGPCLNGRLRRLAARGRRAAAGTARRGRRRRRDRARPRSARGPSPSPPPARRGRPRAGPPGSSPAR